MTYKIKDIIRTFILVACLSVIGAMEMSAQAPTGTNYSNCIFWNLAKADVILLPNKSAGYFWNGSSWEYTTAGNNSSGKLQYIIMDPNNSFDGNPEHLAHASKPVTKPSGGTVEIVNQSNADVGIVLKNWNDRAAAQSHPSTMHRIVASCNQHYQICIDNVWSIYQDYGPDRLTGGFCLFPQMDGATFDVYLKGDNRFGNIFYCSTWQDISTAFKDKDGNTYGYSHPAPDDINFTSAQVVFHSATSSGSTQGTLVVGNISPGYTAGHTYFDYPTTFNFYDAVIGASDNPNYQDSRGIKITGGTIYAGAEEQDCCSAIGAGGNGYGVVTITGGSVTAVTSSTGTAIGGGIGWTDYGGQAEVYISGGDVYAYNHGIVRVYPAGSTKRFVPAAAIGGGSSFEKKCFESTVSISGGTVYAQSVGGVAIGGGGSAMGDGSNATITISGSADVKAKSVTQVINGVTVPYGTSIGGGVGGEGGHGFGDGTGGSCTFTMTGGKLRAGSIGGGSSNSINGGKVGYADATISGSNTDIQGQFIMAAGGTNPCSFTMSAGNLHDSSINDNDYKLVQQNGGAVWLEDPNGVVKITGGTIRNCKANYGGAIYTTGGSVTVQNATIQGCEALTNMGGAICVDKAGATVTVNGATIKNNKAKTNGGAVAVSKSGATVNLTNATITGNSTTQNDGGAFYLGANAAVTLSGGSIKENTSKGNGGAFALGSGATVNITNGIISNNTATSNGGAFWGGNGSHISLTSGNIENNKAKNGGGVYLSSSAQLTYTMTSNTGYIRGNYASECGGGVYLAKGTTANQTKLTFTGSSNSLGFYDNIADEAADDIYAYGRGTTYINFPDVRNMSLGGYSLPGATLHWWEDYNPNYINDYSTEGTYQNTNVPPLRRYRSARDNDLPIYKVESQSQFYTKFLCLTLGFEYGVIEIRRSGLKPNENAIYMVEFQHGTLSRPTQYVVVLGTEESDKTSIGGKNWNIAKVSYLPKGEYKVTELTWTWYKTDTSTATIVKTQDISTDTGRIYEFENDHIDLGVTPLHDEAHKINDLK